MTQRQPSSAISCVTGLWAVVVTEEIYPCVCLQPLVATYRWGDAVPQERAHDDAPIVLLRPWRAGARLELLSRERLVNLADGHARAAELDDAGDDLRRLFRPCRPRARGGAGFGRGPPPFLARRRCAHGCDRHAAALSLVWCELGARELALDKLMRRLRPSTNKKRGVVAETLFAAALGSGFGRACGAESLLGALLRVCVWEGRARGRCHVAGG